MTERWWYILFSLDEFDFLHKKIALKLNPPFKGIYHAKQAVSRHKSQDMPLDGKTTKEVEIKLKNARNQLIDTQAECQELFKILSWARSQMDYHQKMRLKLKFIMDSLTSQVKFFSGPVLDIAIHRDLIEKEWSDNVLIELVKQLHHWQDQISFKIKMLIDTKYDLNDKYNNLGDFICADHVNILQQKIEEVPVIQQQVQNIKLQYNSMKDRVDNQLMKVKLRRLSQYFETNFSADSVVFKGLEHDFVIKVNSYETELADILKSVTDHYDKCELLKQNEMNDEDWKELFIVVKNDDSNLKDIKDILIELRIQITTFSKEFKIKTQDAQYHIDEFQLISSKLLTELEKSEEYITVFQAISNLISIYKNSCLTNINQVVELCHFYDKFKLGYRQLLSEKERRKNLAVRMESIIKDCQSKLKDLSDEDMNKRQLFLLENGDYLPENIWPDFIDDMDPLYELEYSIRNIS